MSYEITRWFEIDAGHRVPEHESKCKNIHGHRYKIGIVLESPNLDTVGRVKDFGTMKEEFGEWLDKYWDHGLILWVGDQEVTSYIALALPTQKFFIMDSSPTAENMARTLYDEFHKYHAVLKEVIIYETPNCMARYPSNSLLLDSPVRSEDTTRRNDSDEVPRSSLSNAGRGQDPTKINVCSKHRIPYPYWDTCPKCMANTF